MSPNLPRPLLSSGGDGWGALAHAHMCTHMRTRAHIREHKHGHVCTLMGVNTCKHGHMGANMDMCTHMCACTLVHICEFKHHRVCMAHGDSNTCTREHTQQHP